MIRVVTAAQAVARDRAAIENGTASFELMLAAGERAADTLLRHFPHAGDGVEVFAGPGNNGGDGWIVAGALAARGLGVHVRPAGEPRTDDARRAHAYWQERSALGRPPCDPPAVVVDALLGTGTSGEPRGDVSATIDALRARREAGAAVVALDVPSGLDASTGKGTRFAAADLTITFGTLKRAHVVARDSCGTVDVVDIGLGDAAELEDGAPRLVDAEWVMNVVPPIPADAHKGARRRIAVVGGAAGMAGATALAARGAMRSGVGMVRLVVAPESRDPVQSAVIEATAVTWPNEDAALAEPVNEYAHAVAVGPGLGRGASSRDLLDRVLRVWRGPTVLDADALTLFAGRAEALGEALGGRVAVLTPHASEFARLAGCTLDEVSEGRFERPSELARRTGAVVLLKGVPTVVASPAGDVLITATGTPALAAAGSGDLLTGIVTTLVAQIGDPLASAACAAWAHGRAAELANAGRPTRGVTLDDVAARLSDVWAFAEPPRAPHVLAALPAVAGRRRERAGA